MKTSRRTFLRGTGAAVALPWLESLAGAQDPAPPTRLFLYVTGGGMYLPAWTLPDEGRRELLVPQKAVEWLGPSAERNEPLDRLSPTLEPLEPHKKGVLVLGGLTLADAFGFEDGHSAEIGALLTCVPYARDRVNTGLSVDQVAARHFEGKTDLGALVLGLNGPRPGGAKGVGRIYAQHYSWRSATTPTGEERNPKLVFDRLFRRGAGGGSADAADRRSVLDHVNEEAKRLRGGLAGADRGKLDEYLAAVRDVELRVERASRKSPDPAAPAFDAGEAEGLARRLPAEKGIPEDYVEYDRLMVDLGVLALRSDLTRVVLLTHGGYRSYPEVGVKRGHHDLQHHEGILEKRQDLEKVDRFNTGRFADVLARFKAIKDGDGTLLDRSMVAFLSGMSNGNRHSKENLPVLLAGRANGTLKPGRYVDYAWKKKTPLANLFVEMLSRLGVPVARFGNSTGGLPHLA